ncbi:MAG: LicD family protein [Clostridia bacterium]|nr:LicD family protein [Clostridia bacterium]
MEITVKELQHELFGILMDFDRLCSEFGIQYSLGAGTLLGAVRHKGFIPWDDDIDLYLTRDNYNRLMSLGDDVFEKRGYYLQRSFSKDWTFGYAKLRKNNTTYIEYYQHKNRGMHQGVFIDLIPIDNLSDNRMYRKMQWYAYRILAAKSLGQRGYNTDSAPKKAAMAVSQLAPSFLLRKICIDEKDSGSGYVHSFFCAAHRPERNSYPRQWFERYERLPFEGAMLPVVSNYADVLTTQYGDYLKLPPEEERVAALHAIVIDLNRAWSDEEIEAAIIKFEASKKKAEEKQ